jgi:type IV pilus assembly protein PilA
MRARQKGFSLIELLIVVSIILIIAAIAIPSFIKSRMAANEASAAETLRTLGTGMTTYSTLCPNVGYPASLVDLGPGPGICVGGANIVDSNLGTPAPRKSGYAFTYGVTAVAGLNAAYTVNGDPFSRGNTGQRSFYIDQTNIIRFNFTAPASVADMPLQ